MQAFVFCDTNNLYPILHGLCSIESHAQHKLGCTTEERDLLSNVCSKIKDA